MLRENWGDTNKTAQQSNSNIYQQQEIPRHQHHEKTTVGCMYILPNEESEVK